LPITRARLSGGVLRQAGKAAWAEAMACSTVALLARATLVWDSPVAGSNTGWVRAVSATGWPSIRWPMVVVTFLSWFMSGYD